MTYPPAQNSGGFDPYGANPYDGENSGGTESSSATPDGGFDSLSEDPWGAVQSDPWAPPKTDAPTQHHESRPPKQPAVAPQESEFSGQTPTTSSGPYTQAAQAYAPKPVSHPSHTSIEVPGQQVVPQPPPASGHSATNYGGNYQFQVPPKNGLATGSLILGILTIVLCATVVISLLTGIIGIVLGVQGRRAADSGLANNPGVAIAGIVTSSVGLGLSLVGVFWLIIFMVAS